MKNTLGENFCVTIFGESHGPYIGVVLDGIAPGIDRIIMLLAGEETIREIQAFPMNAKAQDLLMGAPSAVTQKQLDEIHIKINERK